MHSILIFISFILQFPAFGTSFIQRPFPDAVKEAPVIVQGKVGAKTVEWASGNDGSKRLYTFYPLEVAETLKGSVQGGRLQMRQLGGEKDKIGMQVAGTAQFVPGEEVVVLLGEKNADGSRDVWGLMMGKLNIERDDSGRESLSGPALVESSDPGAIIEGEHLEGERHAPNKQSWSLETLRKLIAAQEGSTGASQPQSADTGAPSHSNSPLVSTSAAGKEGAVGEYNAPTCSASEPEPCASGTPQATNHGATFSPLILFSLLGLGGLALFLARRRLRGH